MTELGAVLREARRKKGQSIREAAKGAGEKWQYLGRLERAEIPEPSADRLARIADYFGIGKNEVFRLAGYDHLVGKPGKRKAAPQLDGLEEVLDRAITDFEKVELIRYLGILRGTHLSR